MQNKYCYQGHSYVIYVINFMAREEDVARLELGNGILERYEGKVQRLQDSKQITKAWSPVVEGDKEDGAYFHHDETWRSGKTWWLTQWK